jgi:ribosomal protein L7Ae-like RNA K-turn-binding protein
LAGLTCGHLQIPFAVFFSATFIGKAVNKVSIQTLFIIFAFSPHLVQSLIEVLRSVWPFLAEKLKASIDAQHSALFSTGDAQETKEEPLLG